MRITRVMLALVLLLACFGPVTVLRAEEVYPKSYLDGATRKLGRGVANIVTAPLELLRMPCLVSQRDGGVSGATVGLAHGVVAMVSRGLSGVVETVTFFAPVPKKDFAPLISPEFVYANGDWMP